jgi:hypothetical protein
MMTSMRFERFRLLWINHPLVGVLLAASIAMSFIIVHGWSW